MEFSMSSSTNVYIVNHEFDRLEKVWFLWSSLSNIWNNQVKEKCWECNNLKTDIVRNGGEWKNDS